jgi:hypothetical protein
MVPVNIVAVYPDITGEHKSEMGQRCRYMIQEAAAGEAFPLGFEEVERMSKPVLVKTLEQNALFKDCTVHNVTSA